MFSGRAQEADGGAHSHHARDAGLHRDLNPCVTHLRTRGPVYRQDHERCLVVGSNPEAAGRNKGVS